MASALDVKGLLFVPSTKKRGEYLVIPPTTYLQRARWPYRFLDFDPEVLRVAKETILTGVPDMVAALPRRVEGDRR